MDAEAGIDGSVALWRCETIATPPMKTDLLKRPTEITPLLHSVELNAAGDKAYYHYCGKERDEESGLYYYGDRYYADWLGRFVSVDPMAEDFPSWTPYHYVHNNPIVLIDPTGMSAEGIVVDGVQYTVGAMGQDESDFVQQTFSALNQIANGDDKRASELIYYFASTDNYEVEIFRGFETQAYVSIVEIGEEKLARKLQSLSFNPTRGLIEEKTGNAFSPDVAIVHELGHLKNAIDDVDGFLIRRSITDVIWRNLEEKETIIKYEVPYAKSRGMLERTSYINGYNKIKTINSTNAITTN